MNELIKYKNNVGMQRKKSDTAGKMYVENRVEVQKYETKDICVIENKLENYKNKKKYTYL